MTLSVHPHQRGPLSFLELASPDFTFVLGCRQDVDDDCPKAAKGLGKQSHPQPAWALFLELGVQTGTRVPSINVPKNSSLGLARARGPGRPVPIGSGQSVTVCLAFPRGGCWKRRQSSSCLRTHGKELGPWAPTLPTCDAAELPERLMARKTTVVGMGPMPFILVGSFPGRLGERALESG